ncbi:MAG TPA: hypothetical protein VEF34_03230 [Syntrophobacteraceae bacterium]|nr:hypothetical protein [Syntrophobacteraceae bacterium]
MWLEVFDGRIVVSSPRIPVRRTGGNCA